MFLTSILTNGLIQVTIPRNDKGMNEWAAGIAIGSASFVSPFSFDDAIFYEMSQDNYVEFVKNVLNP